MTGEDLSWAVAHVLTGQMGGAFHCSICGANQCILVTPPAAQAQYGKSRIAPQLEMFKRVMAQLEEEQKPHWLFRHMFDEQGNVL